MEADIANWDVVLRLALGAVLGGLVGLERESSGQDAGFRTHLLLALGAALFGAASVGAFDDFITDQRTNVQVDVTRIASYVAAGVGFLGGGAILKHAGTVRGITTASSLWAAAAIGLSAGLGFWEGAVTATVISLIALALLKPVSDWIGKRTALPKTLVVVMGRAGIAPQVLGIVQELVTDEIKSAQVGDGHDDDTVELTVQFWDRPPEETVRDVMRRLDDAFGPEIKSVALRS